MVAIFLFVLLAAYGIYLWYYPYIYIETTTKKGARYPLIEFAFQSSGEEETLILRSVCRAGFRPLVAHPERYTYLQHDPEIVNRWCRLGCLFQVNRGSLLGRFGGHAQALAYALVDAAGCDSCTARFSFRPGDNSLFIRHLTHMCLLCFKLLNCNELSITQ